MSFFSFLTRKKWAKLGAPVPSNTLYEELWARNPAGVYLRDRDYQAIPFADFMELVADYRRTEPFYAKDAFDCDDYAVCFEADVKRGWAEEARDHKALTFGQVDGHNAEDKLHAWVWHRDDRGIYRWIEPQLNRQMIGTPRSFRLFWG